MIIGTSLLRVASSLVCHASSPTHSLFLSVLPCFRTLLFSVFLPRPKIPKSLSQIPLSPNPPFSQLNFLGFRQPHLGFRPFEMMEAVASSIHGGFPQFQSFGDSSEEELSVLPRHTKVVVTGNNRTKSVLVGLRGVVKKAVGLGGWHWLVLTNGIEVKLQRNALSVIEAPTGNEEDDELEFENLQWNGLDMASDGTLKSHRSRHKLRKSSGSSLKSMSRSLSCDSQSKSSVSALQGSTRVDLSKLEMAALWRYWRHFNLVDAIPNPSKEQLVDLVRRHFMSQQLDELQVIMGFAKAAKRLKTVCK